MYESFEYLEEGIIYGYLVYFDNKFITLKIKSKEFSFINNLKNKNLDIKKDSFVRVYVKEKRVLFIEKLNNKNHMRFKDLLNTLNKIASKFEIEK